MKPLLWLMLSTLPLLTLGCVAGDAAGSGADRITRGERATSFRWQSYADVGAAGYSADRLAAARDAFYDLGGAAVLVVADGKILANWGDTNRRFFNASVRKGYLNALMGIGVERGQLDLDASVGNLGIDDVQRLTDRERAATLRHLITARSGVYHPAAFEDPAWRARRPARGSSAPGERWYYNNWDFNVLGYVYEQATGTPIFEAFQTEIADPLGMQDFRSMDGTYFAEPDLSHYPAYLFKTSARDMARFGLLYLNDGIWNGRRLLPAAWIERSLQPASAPFGDGTGFGYLWWYTQLDGHDVYYAQGAGTQGIYLVPAFELVYVFRNDAYGFERIDDAQALDLLAMILDAKIGDAAGNPALTSPRWPERLPEASPAAPDTLRRFFGRYDTARIGAAMLTEVEGEVHLVLKRGRFRVLETAAGYVLEDLEMPLELIRNAESAGQADFTTGVRFRLYASGHSPPPTG